jgi:hypothetical protein
MLKYTFQLTCGTEFTIPAYTVSQAWVLAIQFLSEHGQLEDLRELTLNGFA